MVILRPTQKLRRALPTGADVDAESDTALGDWYVNRLVVDRRPLLLLVSSQGLLPLLTPARDVGALPAKLPSLVAAALRRLDVADAIVAQEVAAMSPVIIAPTRDRSVRGIMVDTAKSVPYHLERGQWDELTLPFVEARLAQTPWHAGKRGSEVVFPSRDVPRLLDARWRSAR